MNTHVVILGAGFGVLTLTAFIISTTPGGFFQVHERWTGIPVWLSAISGIMVNSPCSSTICTRNPAYW